jgi:hypothetical protein
MAILKLHQLNNPNELELIDSTDISSVDDYNGHATITTHASTTKYVTETAEQIYNMIMGG